MLATGAVERPLVFPGNDRPGVMLASAGSTYLHRYGVSVGSRIVVVTGCDAAYATALDLHAAGATVALVADVRDAATGAGPAAARAAGLEVVDRATVLGTSGRLGLRSVELGSLVDGTILDRRTIACDALLMSGGYTPSVHLFSQSRGKLAWDAGRQAFLPDRHAERERSAGACRGVDGLESVLNDGSAGRRRRSPRCGSRRGVAADTSGLA